MNNTVRITSGTYRGRKILTPGNGTHPMGERERLALFNMITSELAGAIVLDAYAGSGALGIEALSRGAARVVFVEKAAKAVRIIQENLRSLGLVGLDSSVGESQILGDEKKNSGGPERAEIVLQDVVKFTTDVRFGVILADPPYDAFELTGVGHLAGLLDEVGILVLSHPGEAPDFENLELKKSRSYAGATISIYQKS